MTVAFIPVIDVSEYQGFIDWRKVKESGINHAYIRLCNGTKLDKQVSRNTKQAKHFDVKFGFYCYWHPQMFADKQAKMLCDYSLKYGAELMPMLDVEAHDDQKPRVIVNKLVKSVEVITQRMGKKPVIYTAAWFWNTRVNSILFSDCPLWVARYNHYSLAAFHDPAHKIPADPALWDEYALSHTKPDKVDGWGVNAWVAWQFAGGYDAVGKRYGMESRDLDLNILKSGQMSRILTSRLV